MRKLKKYLHLLQMVAIILVSCMSMTTYVSAGPDDVYVFKDSRIEEAVRWVLGISVPNPVLEKDLLKVTYIAIFDSPVDNLDDLEMFTELQGLELVNVGLTDDDLSDDMFINNTKLQYISLNNNEIKTLPVGLLNGVTDIRTVTLAYNKIETLPVNLFHDKAMLEQVYLNDNKIKSIDVGVFGANLPNLYILDLSMNEITTIQPGVFSNLVDLRDLNLAANKISSLAEGSFSGIENLEGLRLQENHIEVLRSEYFKGLSKLNYLDLSCNRINTINSGVFDELDSLYDLSLLANQIQEIPANAFVGVSSNLTRLNLEGNWISTMNADSFNGLPNLEVLYLGYNRLVTLPAGVFSQLSNLYVLDITYNQIEKIHPDAFKGAGNLMEITLDYNELSELESGVFDDLVNLQYISVRYNRISTLPADLFKNNSALQTVDFAINRLVTLPAGIFDSTPKLRYINLYQNSIMYLPDDIFKVSFNDWKDEIYDYYSLQMEQVFVDEASVAWFDSTLSNSDFQTIMNTMGISILVSEKWHIGPVPMETKFSVDSGKLSPIHFGNYNDADQTTMEEKAAISYLTMVFYKYSVGSISQEAIEQELLALFHLLIPSTNGMTLQNILLGLRSGTIHADPSNQLATHFLGVVSEMLIDYDAGKIDAMTVEEVIDYMLRAFVATQVPGLPISHVPDSELENIKMYFYYKTQYIPYGVDDFDGLVKWFMEEDVFRATFDMSRNYASLLNHLVNNQVSVNGKPISGNNINEWFIYATNAVNGTNYNLQTNLLSLASDMLGNYGVFEQYPYMFFWETGNFCQDQTITFTTLDNVSVVSVQGVTIGEYNGIPLAVNDLGNNEHAITITGGIAFDILKIELRYTGDLKRHYDDATIANFAEAELRDLSFYIYTDMKSASETEVLALRITNVNGAIDQTQKTVSFTYPEGTDITDLNIDNIAMSAGCTYEISNDGKDFSKDVTLKVYNCSKTKFTEYTIKVNATTPTNPGVVPPTNPGVVPPPMGDNRMITFWLFTLMISVAFIYSTAQQRQRELNSKE